MSRPAGRCWWALAALVLSVLTIGLGHHHPQRNPATIAADLAAGTDTLQWIVNAHVLVFAELLLPLGAVGDRYGRKRLMHALADGSASSSPPTPGRRPTSP